MEKFSSSKLEGGGGGGGRLPSGGGGGGGGGYQLHSVGGEVSIQGNSFLGVDKKLLQTSEEEVT